MTVKSSRNVQFQLAYEQAFERLKSQLFIVGRKAWVGGWKGRATRTRVRRLARESARHQLKMERSQ